MNRTRQQILCVMVLATLLVCAEAFKMRDAFADGYPFTRAINMQTAKGAIPCWDLRKTTR